MKPDDLSTLEVLDENTIIQALRSRFQKDKFYTYIGDILVAVNPCKPIGCFAQKNHDDYDHLTVRSAKPPHLFWVADHAYRNLRQSGQNQCILVSGESGAGKTESTKYMIRHLMRVSPSEESSLLHKIVQVNPLLEAFGNAMTIMNGNSSRFGKFIELHYTDNGSLLGAKIDDYILEKSRVVHRSPGEKNFHVFYALFAGMSRERLLYYFLEDPDCHRIMRDDDPSYGVFRDPEEFQYYRGMFSDLTSVMSEIGFTDEHITLIFLILASVLHLANIVFIPCEETDGVSVVDEYPLHAVAKLLGIDDEVELTEALISNVNHIKGEKIQSWKNLREANDSRDALVKELYSRLFGWIVGQVNRNLFPHNHKGKSKFTRGPSIGLLDMSGFENFIVNGFDQFLINISNEKLQQYFMDYIFPREKKEYEMEGIEWRDIMYRTNDGVLDLIFRRPDGILSLLDEESLFPQSNDGTLVQKLSQYCAASDNFVPSKGNRVFFGIKHYAEQVSYSAEGFLERNRDNLSTDLIQCLLHSNNDFIKDLFTCSMSPTGTISDFASKCSSRPKLPPIWPSTIDPKKLRESLSRQASLRIKRRSSLGNVEDLDNVTISRGLSGQSTQSTVSGKSSPTVTRHFKRSLSDLMTKLTQAQPLFVRCLKPNHHITAEKFDADLVRRQLLCNGLMEIAELRKEGFPIRIKFEDFADRYADICDTEDEEYCTNDSELCLEILRIADIHGYKMGKTKVFLKMEQKDDLEAYLTQKMEAKEKQRREEELRRLSEASLLSTITQETGEYPHDHSTPRHSSDSGLASASSCDQISPDRSFTDSYISAKRKKPAPSIPATEDSRPSRKRLLSDDGKSTTVTNTIDMEEEESNSWRPYDMFQVAEREFEDNDAFFREILKGIRLFLYVFLLVAILGATVASKLSLLLLTSGVNTDATSSGEHIVLLLFCLCGPIAWNWLMALMKILFGGKEWPSFLTFLILLSLEGLQTFGVCLMLFRVLPSTDFFRGLISTFAVCQVPSLLKVVVHEKRPNPSLSEVVGIIMNIAAFLVQVAAIPFFSVGEFILEGNYTILEGYNATSFTETTVSCGTNGKWELPLALILISVGWWENYVSGDWTIFGKIKIPFKQWRSILQNTRETSYFLVGPFKIGLSVLLARVLTNNIDFLLPETKTQEDASGVAVVVSHLHSYGLLYIQLGSGIICTYLAGLACKLHMQRVAFSIPIMMAPPVTLMVIYMQCHFTFLPATWHLGGWFCPEKDIMILLMPLICAVLLWLSYSITVSHIWFPQSERMAKIEKLFVTPHFDSIFPDFTLSLRRRRNDKEVRLTGFDTFRYVGEDGYSEETYSTSPNIIPKVYVCATMWHETRQEMTQLLKSLFRLDYVHCASRLAQEKFRIKDPDYFDLEMHIIFDDAFDLDDSVDKFVPNSFVQQFVDCLEDAARSVVKGPITIADPVKVPTPYGGRLVWTMPGHTKLTVHVKDKNKIRHRKRWSQVMYLYYLLGYRLIGGQDTDKAFTEESESTVSSSKPRNRKKKSKKSQRSRPMRSLFTRMNPEQYEKAENTFILTLDGDVDFRPDSVKLLIDRMKKNRKVGAVCGRIHPIGSGPMVWYQQFEYAVGHWLQKAAEHVFGCVLCCPGCFSLFRGSAIMDDNVLKMYTTKPTEARHYIQFEQGEDRWLCTLLLQQGHRIDYCAGADALTFAPETFNEFFNQRRRWSPSTLANMMDLLSGWRDTVRINDNISRPYVLYQFVLMASTILGPSTIILMITGSYHSVLQIKVWEAYLLSLLPVIVYLVICMTMKNSHQITAAAVISALYAIIMMVATVGTIISIVTENFGSPNVVFLTGLTCIFLIAGILHPQEFFCLGYGVLYFMTVPSTFILLTVYYLCNLNNVSWGTREVPKRLSKEEEEELQQQVEEKQKKKERKSICNRLGLTTLINDAREMIHSFMGVQNAQTASNGQTESHVTVDPESLQPRPGVNDFIEKKTASETRAVVDDVTPEGWEPDPDHPYWLGLDYIGHGRKERLNEDEADFWRFMLSKYLHPLDEDKSHKEKIKNDLISLRNNVVFVYFMINFLWTIITLQLQTMEDKLKQFYIINKYEPLSLVFLSVFAIAISLQFFSMFIHRWGTFLHLMSSTRIDWFKQVQTEEDFVKFVVNEAARLQRMEPAPDYDEVPPDYDDDDETLTTITGNESEQYDELPSIASSRHNTYKSYRTFRRSKSMHGGRKDKDVPLLQQIFEDRLENLHRKWKQGTLSFRKNNQFTRSDSHRFSQKENNMRERMFQRSFKRDHDSDRPQSDTVDV